MRFSQELAERTADLLSQISRMPFNRLLASGALDRAIFRGYIVQDAHYLEGFARALALAASRAPDAPAVAQLSGAAAGAIAAERELHLHYMKLFGVSPDAFAAEEPSAACDHYVSFLLRKAAIGEFPEAVAALLPCFWIYRDVGREIAEASGEENPYAAWIATYSSDAFDESVEQMIALTDRLAASADGPARERMHRAFGRACWHEWRFWDSAHRKEGWCQPAE